ncbi:MAG: 3-isopropylmalate/(R)-2-methylmalate dehydratase small subunit [Verrucomicrobiota bacterium]|jgi:3-isopropylmalate/(R)-2-methylmalate dehydratase small subunit|nr:3-isopropylmalate/(R)-2-methylmalate dehydratase small subunit [Verrucomicrobiota bacterium]MDK2962828.1 3-isopropylmalate/(R)-2-methylmalate dehydratase small subunit [Verrucomicrobiota bacterium]
MEKFKTFTGIVAGVDRANIDTDAIIPKEYLRSIKRTGFGAALFSDWRYTADGSDNPDFVLNKPETAGAEILVARNNFGCGSSREHAVWAVQQYGFKVVIAPQENGIPAFADIFRNNCAKNGLLTIELTEAQVNEIFQILEREPGIKATVNLEEQRVTVHASTGDKVYRFDVDPALKDKLLKGLDDIAQTLQYESDIAAYEAVNR